MAKLSGTKVVVIGGALGVGYAAAAAVEAGAEVVVGSCQEARIAAAADKLGAGTKGVVVDVDGGLGRWPRARPGADQGQCRVTRPDPQRTGPKLGRGHNKGLHRQPVLPRGGTVEEAAEAYLHLMRATYMTG